MLTSTGIRYKNSSKYIRFIVVLSPRPQKKSNFFTWYDSIINVYHQKPLDEKGWWSKKPESKRKQDSFFPLRPEEKVIESDSCECISWLQTHWKSNDLTEPNDLCCDCNGKAEKCASATRVGVCEREWALCACVMCSAQHRKVFRQCGVESLVLSRAVGNECDRLADRWQPISIFLFWFRDFFFVVVDEIDRFFRIWRDERIFVLKLFITVYELIELNASGIQIAWCAFVQFELNQNGQLQHCCHFNWDGLSLEWCEISIEMALHCEWCEILSVNQMYELSSISMSLIELLWSLFNCTSLTVYCF